ncbi:hypothetical protein VK792_09345 [Mesobacterium sp. TK19101]|uniref:Lipoprotein n=1 Tax=Mesobacterium hydrothermale TaxID=3111907 RepID=A0ABU6HGE5_9RHOB|nr:hypothetical protein [Mesobacterium sp. TK19101]MEC3861487.1 hypothetical protein [Mesobacterium sp. TK19101]
MRRLFLVFSMLLGLAACAASTDDLEKPGEPLGDFRLGHAGIVAPNLEKLLVSRDATKEEWIAAVDTAVEKRFRRFEGDKYYHLGISVEAYSLPPPVVPGKSALALRVTVWDDAAGKKLNEETEVISVIKVFESRLANTREDQIRILADDVALELEKWMRKMQAEKGWFGGLEANDRFGQVPALVPESVAPETPAVPEAQATETTTQEPAALPETPAEG